MNLRSFFFILLMTLWLTACGTEAEIAVQPTASTNTVVATATDEPVLATSVPTVTAVATKPTIEPSVTAANTPTSQPTPEADPYLLARQILEQAVFYAPDGWTVQPCEGEAAVLCVSDGQENVGFAELILFPLAGYATDHPIRLAADNLPIDGISYSHEQLTATQQALNALAAEHLDIIAADRAITFPNDTFTPLAMESVRMGALPGLAFGFVHTNEAGTVQERYLNVAAFDAQFIYWLGISYDPAYGFVSDTAVTQFAPFLYDIAARLPIHQPSLSNLPQLIPAVSLSGDFPADISWSLATKLPQAATAVAILSQPTNMEPLTAEQAALVGQQYGFDEPLYLEYRTGFTMDELMDLGMFVIFDGWRNLSLSGSLYFYNDASHQPAAFDLPFTEAAPIAEQFLKDNGWLTFPYEMAESDQGEGVLFLPIINGVLLSSPAYGVRVAGDGGIATVFIYRQDNLDEVGRYPILTADSAWQKVLANPNQHGIFYQIDAPAMETPITYPPTYTHLPKPGETGTVHNNIWVYRPVAGDVPPIIVSSNFSRINGDSAMLEELAAETDYLVQLTGTVREPSPGVQTLDLASWQLMTDMGGLPRAFGQIAREDGQTFLIDAANNATYLLPDAPADLQLGVETAVSGIPDTIDGVQTLNWQEIEAYPPQAETIMPTPIGSMQSVTVDSAKLVYLRLPAHVSGLADTLYFPVWQFKGMADNSERVTVWVTAVLPDYISPPNP